MNWLIADAEELSKQSPESFTIPSKAVRKSLKAGDYAKLIFRIKNTNPSEDSPEGERMWVKISKKTSEGYEGNLDNDPQIIKQLSAGDLISFSERNIVDIQK